MNQDNKLTGQQGYGRDQETDQQNQQPQGQQQGQQPQGQQGQQPQAQQPQAQQQNPPPVVLQLRQLKSETRTTL